MKESEVYVREFVLEGRASEDEKMRVNIYFFTSAHKLPILWRKLLMRLKNLGQRRLRDQRDYVRMDHELFPAAALFFLRGDERMGVAFVPELERMLGPFFSDTDNGIAKKVSGAVELAISAHRARFEAPGDTKSD